MPFITLNSADWVEIPIGGAGTVHLRGDHGALIQDQATKPVPDPDIRKEAGEVVHPGEDVDVNPTAKLWARGSGKLEYNLGAGAGGGGDDLVARAQATTNAANVAALELEQDTQDALIAASATNAQVAALQLQITDNVDDSPTGFTPNPDGSVTVAWETQADTLLPAPPAITVLTDIQIQDHNDVTEGLLKGGKQLYDWFGQNFKTSTDYQDDLKGFSETASLLGGLDTGITYLDVNGLNITSLGNALIIDPMTTPDILTVWRPDQPVNADDVKWITNPGLTINFVRLYKSNSTRTTNAKLDAAEFTNWTLVGSIPALKSYGSGVINVSVPVHIGPYLSAAGNGILLSNVSPLSRYYYLPSVVTIRENLVGGPLVDVTADYVASDYRRDLAPGECQFVRCYGTRIDIINLAAGVEQAENLVPMALGSLVDDATMPHAETIFYVDVTDDIDPTSLLPTTRFFKINVDAPGYNVATFTHPAVFDETAAQSDQYTEVSPSAPAPEPDTYLDLPDTPNTYAGQAGKYPVIKNDETGVEFVNLTINSSNTISGLGDPVDTAGTITGDAPDDFYYQKLDTPKGEDDIWTKTGGTWGGAPTGKSADPDEGTLATLNTGTETTPKAFSDKTISDYIGQFSDTYTTGETLDFHAVGITSPAINASFDAGTTLVNAPEGHTTGMAGRYSAVVKDDIGHMVLWVTEHVSATGLGIWYKTMTGGAWSANWARFDSDRWIPTKNAVTTDTGRLAINVGSKVRLSPAKHIRLSNGTDGRAIRLGPTSGSTWADGMIQPDTSDGSTLDPLPADNSNQEVIYVFDASVGANGHWGLLKYFEGTDPQSLFLNYIEFDVSSAGTNANSGVTITVTDNDGNDYSTWAYTATLLRNDGVVGADLIVAEKTVWNGGLVWGHNKTGTIRLYFNGDTPNGTSQIVADAVQGASAGAIRFVYEGTNYSDTFANAAEVTAADNLYWTAKTLNDVTDQAAPWLADVEYPVGTIISHEEANPADDNLGELFNWRVTTQIDADEFAVWDASNFATIQGRLERFAIGRVVGGDASRVVPDGTSIGLDSLEMSTNETSKRFIIRAGQSATFIKNSNPAIVEVLGDASLVTLTDVAGTSRSALVTAPADSDVVFEYQRNSTQFNFIVNSLSGSGTPLPLVGGYVYSGIDTANSSFGSGAVGFRHGGFNSQYDPKGLVDAGGTTITIDTPEKAGAYMMALNVTSGSVAGAVEARVNGLGVLVARGEDAADSDAAMGVIELNVGDVVTLQIVGGGTTYGISFTMSQVSRFIDETQYVDSTAIIPVEDAEVVLIDVDASNNTFYSFSTGETLAQIKAEYENLRFDINTSRSGTSAIRSNTIFLDLSTINTLTAQAGYWITQDLQGVAVGINPTSDAHTGFTYKQVNGDAPTAGRMRFRVTGVKKRKTVSTIDTDIIPVITTEVGTPLKAGSTRHYLMLWDGTKMVSTLAKEVWTEGTIGNSGYRKYMVDHLERHARIFGRNVITSSGTISWNLDFALASAYVFAHDLREAQAETASIRVNSRTVNSLEYTLHDSVGTGDSGSNVQFELSGDI